MTGSARRRRLGHGISWRSRWVVAIAALMLVAPAARALERHDDLRGAFAVTIADEDVPRDLGGRASTVGRWEIRFADGVFALSRQDVGDVVSGWFVVDGDLLRVTDGAGVLACAPSEATGTYRWRLDDGRLFLAAVEEPCATRRLLFTTRVLTAAAPCPAAGPGTLATPGLGDESRPAAAATPGGSAEPPGSADGVVAAIDDALARLSACWATRDPERYLALASEAQRDAFLAGGDDGLRRLVVAMAAPVVWDRVDEVEIDEAGRAVVTVRQTSGDHQDFTRYVFVFEDGAWRWDGTIGAP